MKCATTALFAICLVTMTGCVVAVGNRGETVHGNSVRCVKSVVQGFGEGPTSEAAKGAAWDDLNARVKNMGITHYHVVKYRFERVTGVNRSYRAELVATIAEAFPVCDPPAAPKTAHAPTGEPNDS